MYGKIWDFTPTCAMSGLGNRITSRVYQGVFFSGVFIGLDDVESMSWTDELGESVIWGLAIVADGNLLCYPPTCRASWAQSSMVSQHWSQGEESWCTSVPAHSTSCGPWTFYLLLRLVTPPGLTKKWYWSGIAFSRPYLPGYVSIYVIFWVC